LIKRYIGLFKDLRNRLIDDSFRYYFQLVLLCTLLSLVSLFMGIMNIFTHKTVLMIATLSFAVIMAFNVWLLLYQNRTSSVSFLIFEISAYVLFIYFILTGGTEGFSPHWILILPACGPMFLGLKRSNILNAVTLVSIVALLDTTPGNSLLMFQFTKEFCMRYPVVYVAFFLLGLAFELIRYNTSLALNEAQQKLLLATEIDPLTKLANRHWFNTHLHAKLEQKVLPYDSAAILIDIDNFKTVNDVHGHISGDAALSAVSKAIKACIKSDDRPCRWGGEEFFVYLDNSTYEQVQTTCIAILNEVRSISLTDNKGVNFGLTVSIGAAKVPKGEPISVQELFIKADRLMYQAKANGKDRAVIEENK